MRNYLILICALCINLSYATVVCHEAQPSGQVCMSDDPNDHNFRAGAGSLSDTKQNIHLGNSNNIAKPVEPSGDVENKSENKSFTND